MTKSLSNLLKRYKVIEKDERIIDYNDVISEKINTLRKNMEQDNVFDDGFVAGLNPPLVEPILDEDGNPVNMDDFMGSSLSQDGESSDFVQGIPVIQPQIDLEKIQAEADEIIEKAKAEADEIIANAQSQAELICEDAKNQGYEQGKMDADLELEKLKEQMQQQLADYEQQLKEEYDELKSQIEPELVDVLLQVFTNAINVIGEEDQEVILRLINHVLQDTQISTDFVVRVGSDDYKFLTQNQGKIYMSLNNDIQMDIVEDASLLKNQCLIETETGVFNCSLDIQLKSLVKDLKILSCM